MINPTLSIEITWWFPVPKLGGLFIGFVGTTVTSVDGAEVVVFIAFCRGDVVVVTFGLFGQSVG